MQRQDGTLFYAQLRSRRGGRSVAPWHWRLAFSDLTTPGHAEEQLAWNEALMDASRDASFGTTLDGTIVR
jgi:hypothetical protein